MVASGPLTAAPLLLFAAAARRIPLSLMGMLQYINPTMQFLIGVFLYKEPFSHVQFAGFGMRLGGACYLSCRVVRVQMLRYRHLLTTHNSGGRQMDPKKTALVLIEYQNDFTSKGGTLHDAVKGVMEKNNMLQNTVETVKKAREAGCTIVFAPITFVEGYRELSDEPYGILKGVVDSKSFSQGQLGRGDRRRPEAAAGRHRHRRQARPVRLRQHQSRFHSAQPRHRHHRARRLPDQLLRRVDDAHGLREGLQRHHAEGLHGGAERGRTALATEKNYPMFSRPMNHDEFLTELSGQKRRRRGDGGAGHSTSADETRLCDPTVESRRALLTVLRQPSTTMKSGASRYRASAHCVRARGGCSQGRVTARDGAFGRDPVDGAVDSLLPTALSPAAAEAFAKSDPYVVNGHHQKLARVASGPTVVGSTERR